MVLRVPFPDGRIASLGKIARGRGRGIESVSEFAVSRLIRFRSSYPGRSAGGVIRYTQLGFEAGDEKGYETILKDILEPGRP